MLSTLKEQPLSKRDLVLITFVRSQQNDASHILFIVLTDCEPVLKAGLVCRQLQVGATNDANQFSRLSLQTNRPEQSVA